MHVMRTSIQDRRTIGLARILLRGAALLLLTIGAIVLWVRYQGEERRAVSHLPAEERSELYRRELRSFRSLCGQGPRKDALERQCKEKAEFILQFPECDRDCQLIARSHLQRATR